MYSERQIHEDGSQTLMYKKPVEMPKTVEDAWTLLEVIENNPHYAYAVDNANLAVFKIVTETKVSFASVEAELRRRKFKHIWLCAGPRSSEYACRNVFNKKEEMPWAFYITVGSFEWFMQNKLVPLNQTHEQNTKLLTQCGIFMIIE